MRTARYRKRSSKRSPSQEPFFKGINDLERTGQTVPTFFERSPAWSIGGSVYLGAGFFAANPGKQQEILQHESIHALHQLQAPVDNSDAARNHAEYIAGNPGMANAQTMSVGAPVALGFPAQAYDGWNKVYIGAEYIIAELIESGITLRIAIYYSDLGIRELTKKETLADMEMDLIVKDKPAMYHCGPHPFKPMATYIDRVKKVAAITAKVNKKIPAGSPWKTELVVMGPNVNEAFRTANGKGVLELNSININTAFILDSAAHESSHGVFEHHAAAGDTDQSKRVPDNFALAIADLYAQLAKTKLVDKPTAKFDPAIKPAESGTDQAAAGLVMVTDMLWSGSGGHPWDGVDEFFASAYGGYTQNAKLLAKVIDHYIAFDPAIKPFKPVLFNLLKITGNQKKISALKSPASTTEATTVLGALGAVPDHTTPGASLGIVQMLIDPAQVIGPSAIKC